MFKFLLRLEDSEPNDPAVLVTAVPNWTVGETFLTGRGDAWRILTIDTDIDEELVEQGFNGIFTVEPVKRLNLEESTRRRRSRMTARSGTRTRSRTSS